MVGVQHYAKKSWLVSLITIKNSSISCLQTFSLHPYYHDPMVAEKWIDQVAIVECTLMF
jgi:hypothetical protein